MKAPIAELKKKELVWLGKHRCKKHSHTYLEHYDCYLKENPPEDKIGFLDIESSNLKATFGIVYTYAIKELDGKLYQGSVSIKDLRNAEYDKNLLKKLIDDLQHFSRVIGHYFTDYRFDLPFLRTRAVKWGLDFPEYKFMSANDTYSVLKAKFKLHSNRMETACEFFDIPAKGHKMKPDIWLKMITGNPKLMKQALAYIMKHNIEDVYSTEALWKRIEKYSLKGNRSI